MLTPISNYTIVPVTAALLCTFGGRDSAGGMILKTQCYNPVANTVAYKADLPSTFTGFLPGGAAGIGGKAWVFGGFRSTGSPYNHALTYEYDLAANTFTAKGQHQMGRAYINVVVVDGMIYGFGGDTFDGTNLIARPRPRSTTRRWALGTTPRLPSCRRPRAKAAPMALTRARTTRSPARL